VVCVPVCVRVSDILQCVHHYAEQDLYGLFKVFLKWAFIILKVPSETELRRRVVSLCAFAFTGSLSTVC
jgi:hypothetical protein